jgi:alginate biosynthesis protein AlgX
MKRFIILGIAATLVITGLGTLEAVSNQIPVCLKAQQKDLPANAGFGFLTPGRDGSVLYSGDFSPNHFAFEGRSQYYAQLDQALLSKGIRLVVSVLPTRSIVYPESLDAQQPLQVGFNAKAARENYRASLRRLWDLKVYTVDLLHNALIHHQNKPRQRLYFTRDYHWTTDGAKLYANAVAREIAKLDAYKRLKKEKFVNKQVKTETAESRLGFVLEQVCGTKTPPEKISIYETTRSGGSLFGDDSYPVVMVGSSYSAEPKYNFEGFLKEALGVNVLNAAVSGGGYNASLEGYFLSESYHKEKPKFLIWEFAASMTPWDQTSLREIIPSIYGDCSAKRAALSVKSTMRSGTNSVLKNPNRTIRGKQHFVSLKFADKSLRNFELSLKFEDDKQETVQIIRSERIPNEGQFYLKFADEFTGNLKEVTIRTAQKVMGAVWAKVCKI